MEAEVAQRLPTDHGRNALSAVLAKCGNKLEVVAEIRMILDGGRPGCSTRPDAMELALCDFAANESKWSNTLFRRYVQRAGKPEASNGNGRRGGVGERTYQNGRNALRDVPEAE